MNSKTPFSLLTAAILSTSLIAQTVFALSLEEAKTSGQVGEQRNGYLGAPSPSASAEAQKLITEVNAKRRELYKSIAQKNGSPLAVVEQVAAKEAILKSPAGSMIQTPSGTWTKK